MGGVKTIFYGSDAEQMTKFSKAYDHLVSSSKSRQYVIDRCKDLEENDRFK